MCVHMYKTGGHAIDFAICVNSEEPEENTNTLPDLCEESTANGFLNILF